MCYPRTWFRVFDYKNALYWTQFDHLCHRKTWTTKASHLLMAPPIINYAVYSTAPRPAERVIVAFYLDHAEVGRPLYVSLIHHRLCLTANGQYSSLSGRSRISPRNQSFFGYRATRSIMTAWLCAKLHDSCPSKPADRSYAI